MARLRDAIGYPFRGERRGNVIAVAWVSLLAHGLLPLLPLVPLAGLRDQNADRTRRDLSGETTGCVSERTVGGAHTVESSEATGPAPSRRSPGLVERCHRPHIVATVRTSPPPPARRSGPDRRRRVVPARQQAIGRAVELLANPVDGVGRVPCCRAPAGQVCVGGVPEAAWTNHLGPGGGIAGPWPRSSPSGRRWY